MLFVVWWSNAAASDSTEPGVSPTILVANLKSRVRTLEEQIAQITKENKEFKDTIDVLRQMLNPTEPTAAGFRAALQKHDAEVATNARRGKPKCAEVNTLVHLQAIDGRLEMLLLGANDVLQQLGQSWRADQRLTEEDQIKQFLQDAVSYSRARDCRFDYRLTYATPVDYHDARQRFENYFYPEAIIRASR